MWKYFKDNKPPYGQTVLAIDCVQENYLLGKYTRDGYFKGRMIGNDSNHFYFYPIERMSRYILLHEYIAQAINNSVICDLKNKDLIEYLSRFKS